MIGFQLLLKLTLIFWQSLFSLWFNSNKVSWKCFGINSIYATNLDFIAFYIWNKNLIIFQIWDEILGFNSFLNKLIRIYLNLLIWLLVKIMTNFLNFIRGTNSVLIDNA